VLIVKTIPLRDKNFMQQSTENNINQNLGHDPEAGAYEIKTGFP
jgi:hypothetical protein